MKDVKTALCHFFRIGCLSVLCSFSSTAQESASLEGERPLTHEETIGKALQDLESDDVDTRVGSIMLLGKYRVAEALAGVVSGLFDNEVRVRRAALVSLMEIQSSMPPSAVEPILMMMNDQDGEIRRMVSSSLGLLVNLWNTHFRDNQLIPTGQPLPLPLPIRQRFINAFLDEEVVVRRNMLSHYFFLGVQLPEPILLALLEDDDDLVRLEALRLAGRISRFTTILKQASNLVEDSVQSIRLLFANTLGRQPISGAIEWLEMLLEDEDDEVVKEAELSLFRIRPNTREALRLTDYVMKGSFNNQQGITFIQTLPLLKGKSRPFAESILESENANYRLEALRLFLAYANLQVDREKLAKLANDRSERVWMHLMNYLQANRKTVPASLIGDLAFARHEKVREIALTLTRELNKSQAEPLLLDFLIDERARLRMMALDELKRREYGDIRKIMHLSLRDQDGMVQRRSVVLLIGLNDPEELNYLKSVVEENPQSPLANYIKDQMLKRLGVQL